MPGILEILKEKITGLVKGRPEELACPQRIDDHLLALGVLLWIVAEADDKFLPLEEVEIVRVLKRSGKIAENDMSVVMMAVKQAAIMRVDMFQFTQDLKGSMDRQCLVGIVENLFRVAYIDKDLDEAEMARIRQISGLLGLDHDEFILSKERIRKEMI